MRISVYYNSTLNVPYVLPPPFICHKGPTVTRPPWSVILGYTYGSTKTNIILHDSTYKCRLEPPPPASNADTQSSRPTSGHTTPRARAPTARCGAPLLEARAWSCRMPGKHKACRSLPRAPLCAPSNIPRRRYPSSPISLVANGRILLLQHLLIRKLLSLLQKPSLYASSRCNAAYGSLELALKSLFLILKLLSRASSSSIACLHTYQQAGIRPYHTSLWCASRSIFCTPT